MAGADRPARPGPRGGGPPSLRGAATGPGVHRSRRRAPRGDVAPEQPGGVDPRPHPVYGADVVGVEVHPRGPVEQPGELPGGTLPEAVTATVEDGYFAAWWPGISVRDLELTVHLADGTVVADVPVFDDER